MYLLVKFITLFCSWIWLSGLSLIGPAHAPYLRPLGVPIPLFDLLDWSVSTVLPLELTAAPAFGVYDVLRLRLFRKPATELLLLDDCSVLMLLLYPDD